MALPFLALGKASAGMARPVATSVRAGAKAKPVSAAARQTASRAAREQASRLSSLAKSPRMGPAGLPRSGEMVKFYAPNAKGRPGPALTQGTITGLRRAETAKGPVTMVSIVHAGGAKEIPYNAKWFDFSKGKPTSKMGAWMKEKASKGFGKLENSLKDRAGENMKRRAKSFFDDLFNEIKHLDEPEREEGRQR